MKNKLSGNIRRCVKEALALAPFYTENEKNRQALALLRQIQSIESEKEQPQAAPSINIYASTPLAKIWLRIIYWCLNRTGIVTTFDVAQDVKSIIVDFNMNDRHMSVCPGKNKFECNHCIYGDK